jgi:tRNA pseudouridine55 synthase
MGRRKKGSAVHGWVIVDKPQGVTSTRAVSIVRRVFDAQKAGHAGTLDPMATGVLAVALGEATKTVPFAMDSVKLYRFVARWGEARDSDDAEGNVIATSQGRPSRAAIEAALPGLTGEILQVPPTYSAIKIDGERAYDRAREGEPVTLEARKVLIHSARLVAVPDADHAEFEISCGKGAYVRSWVRDLARILGTVGHVCRLRRTALGPFLEAQAIGLEKLEAFMHIPAAFEHLRPISAALEGIPSLSVGGPDAVRLRGGSPIILRANQYAQLTEDAGPSDDLQGLTVFLSTREGEPVALAALEQGELRPFRVFNFGA